jgi:TonB-linked SusC/RagA family outer membrane protein
MVEDIIGLEEVIVTGYGMQKKSDLTGAIASVSGEDLTEIPAASFDDALEGRASGVYASSETGAPDATAVIQIRGVSSINGGDPLIVVDGVPSSIYAINSINASDIASVEVLKDASSQAIYGASGGNGVILITTKKGELNKLTAELDYYFGYQVPKNNVSMCSTEEFFNVYNEIGVPERVKLDWTEDTIPYLPNTNWQEEITRKALMQNINLAISGGNERSTFRFSTGYLTQEGVVPNSDYNKFNVRINSEHKLLERVKIGENIAFTRDFYDGFVNWYFNDFYASPLALALKMHPFVEPYIEGGAPLEYNWGTSAISPGLENPFVKVDIINREVPRYRLKGDMNLAIEIIKGLTFKSIANGGLDIGYLKEFNPIYHYSATNYNEVSSLERTVWKNHSWYLQHTLTYNFSLAQHNLSLMAGYEANYYKNEGFIASIDNLLSQDEAMHYFNSATGSPSLDDYLTIEEIANDAYFGRINWDYKGKYLITSNIRRDQSSKFGPAYRSGIFSSFSLGWKFSEENFMQGLTWLSFGKIRAGWGQIGNSGIGSYKYYARVITTDMYNASLDNETISAGVASHGIPNLELRWEAMKSTNIGIDLAFFNNKLTFSADYFEKSNDGMLIDKQTPDLAGTFQINEWNEGGSTELVANLGEVFTKGYEFTIGFKTKTGDFQHDMNMNFSYVENEVGDIGGDTILQATI